MMSLYVPPYIDPHADLLQHWIVLKFLSSSPVLDSELKTTFRRELLLFMPGFVGIHDRQQRGREQNTPEWNQNAEHDRSQQRSPDRHPGHALHDVGLQQKGI